MLVILDFETMYDSKRGYSLKKMTPEAYITDPRFAVHGVCVIEGWHGEARFLEEPAFRAWADAQDWGKTVLAGHNLLFDASILAWKYGHYPAAYMDTMFLANALIKPLTGKVSLDACAAHFKLPQKSGVLKQVDGLSTDQIKSVMGLWPALAEYGVQDGQVTRELLRLMLPKVSRQERVLIDWTVKAYVRPRLRLDREGLLEHLAKIEAERQAHLEGCGLTDPAILRSTEQFAAELRRMGIIVETKEGKNGDAIPAVAKNDPFMQTLLEHGDPKVQRLAHARLAWASNLEATRTKRLLEMEQTLQGKLAVPLSYHSAHTGRFGGCLVADTLVWIMTDGVVSRAPITAVRDDDLIWDGEEWVTHGGLVYQGVRKVITWDGITGTPDHVVFTDRGEMPLRAARERGHALQIARTPRDGALRAADAGRGGQEQTAAGAGAVLGLWAGADGTGDGSVGGQRAMPDVQHEGPHGRSPAGGAGPDRFAHQERHRRDESGSRQASGHARIPGMEAGAGACLDHMEVPVLSDEESLSTLHLPCPAAVEGLWWSRNRVPVQEPGGSCTLDFESSGSAATGADHRSDRQRRTLRAGQPALGDPIGAVAESPGVAEQGRQPGRCLSRSDGLVLRDHPGTGTGRDDRRADPGHGTPSGGPETQRQRLRQEAAVYDLVDCGPRHRFVANGRLVHNSGGLNVQNLSKGGAMRRAIQAPPGFALVIADLSQIEARIAAWAAGCDLLVETFAEYDAKTGPDPYCAFATIAFGREITKADPVERHVGKGCVLGLQFGCGGTKLATQLTQGGTPTDPASGDKLVVTYRRTYPEIPRFWNRLERRLLTAWTLNESKHLPIGPEPEAPEDEAQDDRRTKLCMAPDGITLPSGRRILYPELAGENEQLDYMDMRWKTRQRLWGARICENVVQAMARDVISAVHAERVDDIVLQVHDELVLLAPEAEAEAVAESLLARMRTPPGWAPGLPLDAEVKISDRYQK